MRTESAEPSTIVGLATGMGPGRRRRLRHRRSVHRDKVHRRVALTVTLIVALTATSATGGYLFYEHVRGDEPVPTLADLDALPLERNSVIFDRHGRRMGVVRSPVHRNPIPLRRMGAFTAKAAIAIEDRRFFEHEGVDAKAIARAAQRDLSERRIVEGGSTITQQTVRLMFSDISMEKSLRRKYREMTLARELEQKWTKERILEEYLNRAYFGNGAYGIEAAALTYFDRRARKLNHVQSATLTGLIQRPSAHDPFRHPQAALERRNDVLMAMRDTGAIGRDQYRKAVKTPLAVTAGDHYRQRVEPHFMDMVRKDLEQEYGVERARHGGLVVRTTIDPRLQKLARTAMRTTLNRRGDPSAALVTIDNASGEIRAMASTEPYSKTRFNVPAQAVRQPGSSAKTWVLAAFLQQGYNPWATRYVSAPLEVRAAGQRDWWKVRTYDHRYPGSMNVVRATLRSDNSVYAQMTMDIGADKVARTAMDLGVQRKLSPILSIGLGGHGVTPLENTNVYTTIARGGVYRQPSIVKVVADTRGREIPYGKRRQRPKRVLQPWQSRTIVEILEQNVRRGTGTAARINVPTAGKTGTTDRHSDAWFCGMTPKLTTCVWVGYLRSNKPMRNVHGIRVTGGSFPAQIWRDYMGPAVAPLGRQRWPRGTRPPLVSHTPSWQSKPGIEVRVGPRRDPRERSGEPAQGGY